MEMLLVGILGDIDIFPIDSIFLKPLNKAIINTKVSGDCVSCVFADFLSGRSDSSFNCIPCLALSLVVQNIANDYLVI